MEERSYLGTDTEPLVAPTSDEKTVALLSHILTIVGYFIAPLVIYMIKKDESEFVREHAKESLNFQITIMIIAFVLVLTIIGAILLIFVGIAALVFVILATIKASEGKLYKYPINFRLIK